MMDMISIRVRCIWHQLWNHSFHEHVSSTTWPISHRRASIRFSHSLCLFVPFLLLSQHLTVSSSALCSAALRRNVQRGQAKKRNNSRICIDSMLMVFASIPCDCSISHVAHSAFLLCVFLLAHLSTTVYALCHSHFARMRLNIRTYLCRSHSDIMCIYDR